MYQIMLVKLLPTTKALVAVRTNVSPIFIGNHVLRRYHIVRLVIRMVLVAMVATMCTAARIRSPMRFETDVAVAFDERKILRMSLIILL